MNYPYRVGIQQRVLPVYRLGLFDLLAEHFQGGLEVFAGTQKKGEGISLSTGLQVAKYHWADNSYLKASRSHLLWQKNLTYWLNELDPDCLIVEINPRNLSTASGIKWIHKNGRKVIGWGLGTPMSGSFAKIKKYFWQNAIKDLNGIITYSSIGKEQFAALGFDPAKIFVAPNAVAPRPGVPPVKRIDEYKNEQPVILFVGKLIHRKKVDRLLRACAKLELTVKPAVWIVGDGPAKAELELMAQRTYPQAQFLGDLRGPDLDPYWSKADLFVLPGTGGLAVQEAMSHGLPVVVGVADGTQADLVSPGNGWQLNTDSDEELVNVLQVALGDIKQLREKGLESYRIVRDEINLATMADRFTDAIAQVMETT